MQDAENEHAKTFYQSNKWFEGIKSRRKKFLQEASIAENPKLLEVESTDDE